MTRAFTTRAGLGVELPVFIPVYRPGQDTELFTEEFYAAGLSACMVNAFFLYKDRDSRSLLEGGRTIRQHIGGFGGMICTDSGAFQGLRRPLYLRNDIIVSFQNKIRSDIAAPIDLITPPGDKRTVAEEKITVSHKRTLEALPLCDYSYLVGMQQGGRFFDLRQRHIRMLAEMEMAYYGIGSLVPFFNRRHDLAFCCQVIWDARNAIGRDKPMHIYGAGDPLEIPFFHRAGADVFDSSSYAHFANQGYYMTPYGAVNHPEDLSPVDYTCTCPVCSHHEKADVFGSAALLRRHNLFVIFRVISDIRKWETQKEGDDYRENVLERHMLLFPDSLLRESWARTISVFSAS